MTRSDQVRRQIIGVKRSRRRARLLGICFKACAPSARRRMTAPADGQNWSRAAAWPSRRLSPCLSWVEEERASVEARAAGKYMSRRGSR
eukprot:5995200-Pleurochrysis_carterae.AAC.1